MVPEAQGTGLESSARHCSKAERKLGESLSFVVPMIICYPGLSITVDESGATLHLELPKTEETIERVVQLYQDFYPWLPAQFQLQDLNRVHREKAVIWCHDPEALEGLR